MLEVVEEENLVEQARQKGAYLHERLQKLAERYEISCREESVRKRRFL